MAGGLSLAALTGCGTATWSLPAKPWFQISLAEWSLNREIRKGEIVYSTRGVMLAGNVFEVLENVSAVANNQRKIGQLISPWILVENVRVIGK